MEGLGYGGKFALLNRLGLLIVGILKYVLPYRFSFVLFFIWGQFPSISPKGLYSKGRLNGSFFFLRYKFRGHIFGNAYAWRGLFSEFYGICNKMFENKESLTIVKSDFFLCHPKKCSI